MTAHLRGLGSDAPQPADGASLSEKMDAVCGQMRIPAAVIDCVLASSDFDAAEGCAGKVLEPGEAPSVEELYQEAKKIGVEMPELPKDEPEEDESGSPEPAPID